jgi:RHS repeat-associated protein
VQYDGWERVTAVVSFRNGSVVARDTFGFDRMGNIKTTAGAEVYDPVTNRLAYRVNATWQDSLVYDAAGNLDSLVSKKGGATNRWGYDWDALNRLVTVRRNGTLIARYSYDVLGRRIAKRVYSTVTGGADAYTRFVYHGNHVAFEADSGAGGTIKIWKRYVWGMGTDDLIAVRDSSSGTAVHSYAVKDKLGSVRGLVKRDGTWQYSKRFGPYGAEVEASGTDVGLRYRWTGREYDAETGFYYFRARYYEPAARRFISEDPIGYGGGSNLYAYVDGQVLEARDPTGLTPFVDLVNIMNEPGYNPKDMGLFFKTARQEFDEWVIKSMREAAVFEAWYSLRSIDWGGHNDLRQDCAENPICAGLVKYIEAGSTDVVVTKNTSHTDEAGWTDCVVSAAGRSSCVVSINEGSYADWEPEFGVLNNGIVLAHEFGHVSAAVGEYLARGQVPSTAMSNSWAIDFENRARVAYNYGIYGSYADIMTPRRTYHD